MLKAWNFTKNKIYHECFDNNLQKLFWTKILKDSNGQKILIVALMVDLWLKPQMELIKMSLSLLVLQLNISPFEL